MKKRHFLVLGMIGLFFSCSNPNDIYIEKIKEQVKKDALGIEMNYQNISFDWTDTLFVKEQLSKVKDDYTTRLNVILNIEYFIKDNFEKGKIFSKSYITKERYTELRNWETKVGHPNKYSYGGDAIWVEQGYKDYFEFAFANRDGSSFISQLCLQIENTDDLLKKYDELEDGNLELMENVLWFYKRIDSYESSKNPDKIWSTVFDEIGELKVVKAEIDSLSSLPLDKVIYYKALNVYKINNPMLNSAEQELKKYFLFDESLQIIGKEKYKE